MKILLLGHRDIASLFAMERIIRLRPGCQFTVRHSLAIPAAADEHPALVELARQDRVLCERFLDGGLGSGKPSQELCESKALVDPNNADGINDVAALAPDLIISIRYRRILQSACIQLPRLGVLNLHSGLLPDYRGVMATFWAMLHDAAEIGSTLHYIVDAGIDTGPIICRQSQKPVVGHSYLRHVLSLYVAGTDAIIDALESEQNLRKSQPNAPDSGGRYFSQPNSDAVDSFLAKGLQLTDGAEETLIKSLISESYK